MNSVFDAIDGLSDVARIAALRAAANSSLSRAIGAIRQDIRDKKRLERKESDPESLDERNHADEDNRSVAEIAEAMRFEQRLPALELATQYHAIYNWADNELKTLEVSEWDEALNLRAMLDYMTEKAQPVDLAVIKEIAKVMEVDESIIIKMHEIQDIEDRSKLKQQIPEIISIWNTFDTHIDKETLEPVQQHQLGLKIIDGLNKSLANTTNRIIRARRLDQLGDLTFLKTGIQALRLWASEYQKQHREAIRDAIHSGANIRTLADVK